MEVEPPVAEQLALNRRCLVGGVVVEDEMDIEVVEHLDVDALQEFPELDSTVALVKRGDDGAGHGVEGGEQRGGAVTDVVIGSALGVPGTMGSTGWERLSAWA